MRQYLFILAGLAWVSALPAAERSITMQAISPAGTGESIGTIQVREDAGSLVFTPDLHALAPGAHGFHVHENPACGAGEKDGKPVAGMAAGGHYDPEKTGQHSGPEGAGHKGDLPVLTVAADGTARTAVRTKRLTLAELAGHSLMIHAEADNYADQPGGARVACGIVP